MTRINPLPLTFPRIKNAEDFAGLQEGAALALREISDAVNGLLDESQALQQGLTAGWLPATLPLATGDGTWTQLTFTGFENVSWFDGRTWTCPVGGLYAIGVAVDVTGITANHKTAAFRFNPTVGSPQIYSVPIDPLQAPNNIFVITRNVLLRPNIGWSIDFKVQNGGTDKVVNLIGGGPEWTQLSIARLTPENLAGL